MWIKTTIHQHALINPMACSKKKKKSNQIICWCNQLRKFVAPVQPVEKLVWSPAAQMFKRATDLLYTSLL